MWKSLQNLCNFQDILQFGRHSRNTSHLIDPLVTPTNTSAKQKLVFPRHFLAHEYFMNNIVYPKFKIFRMFTNIPHLVDVHYDDILINLKKVFLRAQKVEWKSRFCRDKANYIKCRGWRWSKCLSNTCNGFMIRY